MVAGYSRGRVIAFALAASIAALAAQPAPECDVSPGDRAWLDRSMKAWNYASAHISGIGRVKDIQAIIFDDRCVVTSDTAMNGGPNRWTGHLHGGKIVLPGGQELKPQVISFAQSEGSVAHFVMSTPSIWRAAKKSGKGTSLENLMTAVIMHEATHVAQMPTYGKAIGAIADRYHLPEEWSDDFIQEQFGKNAEFARSIDRESALLLQAAESRDRRKAARLVQQARDLMRARYARWFTGKNVAHAEAEPVWLTLEGSGQWIAYRWLIDAKGAGVKAADVRPGFVNDKWWSQREGFAAFMALERLTGSRWKEQAFRLGGKDVLQMLDEAVRLELGARRLRR
jgi:hypothetical protein